MSEQAKKATGWGRAGHDPTQMTDLALKFPIGTRVTYIGTQAQEQHHGKIAMVYGYVDANGLKLRYEEDGSLGTSIPRNVKLVHPPNLAPN